MRTSSSPLARLAFIVAIAGCSDSRATGPTSDTFDWQAQLTPGQSLEIKGISGGIAASPTSGNITSVSALLHSPTTSVDDVTLDVVTHAGGVTICAVYPDIPGAPPNVCLPGDQGSLSNHGSDVSVEFTVTLPAGVTLIGSTISGDIAALALDSDVFATTVSGGIELETSRHASATVVSGSITASVGLSDWEQDLAFTSVSGDVTVTVPASTNATVDITVVSGSMTSDFPTTQVGPGHWSATLGTGGPLLSLSTVSGSLRLRSGS